MPASEGSLLGKTMEFGAYGVLGGALWGAIDAGMRDPVPGAPLRGAVARMGTHAGWLGAVAAVFGGTNQLAETFNPHGETNAVVAGCAAGALLGAAAPRPDAASLPSFSRDAPPAHRR
jgi:hypothetical protein